MWLVDMEILKYEIKLFIVVKILKIPPNCNLVSKKKPNFFCEILFVRIDQHLCEMSIFLGGGKAKDKWACG
jgi:hypothetical protein